MEDRARRLVTGEPPLDRFAISSHLMEICGGTGGLSRAAGARGLSVGPNVELKKGMDLLDPNVFGWVRWSILRGRIYCLVVEPPCTTDSLARCPKLRSSWTPNGFDPLHLQTLTGNTISAACLYLALIQHLVGNVAVAEQPGGGFMRFRDSWLGLMMLGFEPVPHQGPDLQEVDETSGQPILGPQNGEEVLVQAQGHHPHGLAGGPHDEGLRVSR